MNTYDPNRYNQLKRFTVRFWILAVLFVLVTAWFFQVHAIHPTAMNQTETSE